MPRIVLVDDDSAICTTLNLHLTGLGFEVEIAENADAGFAAVDRACPDLVICDIRMEGRDGLSLLAQVAARWPRLPVIMVTAFHDLETTVAAMQRGAVDYIPKPIDLDQLDGAIERALMRRGVELTGALEIGDDDDSPRLMVGHSRVMTEVFKTIGVVAQSTVTVMITGPSGTGKELVARAIHTLGRNPEQPFLAINCAALVDDLIENELFGHERGAYTGASSTEKGKVELVGVGTLFLDEIAELSMRVQGKLLRLLEQREFIPVGGSRARSSRCRFVVATNVDLEQRVREGKFRSDLYHRLHVISIRLPALRERPEDIPLLVRFLIKRINRGLGRNIRFIAAEVLDRLVTHDWPGNVRELENVLIRAAIMESSDTIRAVSLPAAGQPTAGTAGTESVPHDGTTSLRNVERDHIEKVLTMTAWQKSRACDILGISRPTLDRRIREFGLVDPRPDPGEPS